MISPSYSMTATERVLPRLALDFTTAVLDPRITFTRSGNTATVIDSTGVIVAVNADIPRFDYNPSTLVCNGLLIEESRTNELLNSLLDGTSLATQSVTVTAAARTLSFYGTGEVVLSGAHSATVTGTGAYPTRTTLTFTPSAGTLTLTVTGTVQFAQLEAGAFATSYIPTEASQVTRTADVATMTGTDFSDWFNASEGTFVVKGSSALQSGSTFFADITNGTSNERMRILFNSASEFVVTDNGITQAAINAGSIADNTTVTISATYKANSFAGAVDGGTVVSDNAGTLPIVDQMSVGANRTSTGQLNGHYKYLNYFPQQLTNAEVQTFSK